MYKYFFLKTPVYIMDEGPDAALLLFLAAIGGFLLFKLGIWMDNNVKNPWLSAFGAVFVTKFGVGIMLTGIISGIISLF